MNSYEVTRVGPRPWHQFSRRSKTLQGPVGDRVSRPRPWLNELEFPDLTQHWLGFATVSETDRHRAKRVKLLSAAVSALASVIVLLTRFSRLQITLPLHLMTGDHAATSENRNLSRPFLTCCHPLYRIRGGSQRTN